MSIFRIQTDESCRCLTMRCARVRENGLLLQVVMTSAKEELGIDNSNLVWYLLKDSVTLDNAFSTRQATAGYTAS